eukprot:GHRQ01027729.1.p1 GENE.GHRQ01027729.1~~GHRQ01027729.1.p1  ORF type:complete len:138 (+),score=27.42 GHRQ01027729.1:146-559(+)
MLCSPSSSTSVGAASLLLPASPPATLSPSSRTPRSAKTPTPRKSNPKPYRAPKPYTHLDLPGVDPRLPLPGWSPPVSPFGLLEEELWRDPWRLLLGCMLLNKTTSKQVRLLGRRSGCLVVDCQLWQQPWLKQTPKTR